MKNTKNSNWKEVIQLWKILILALHAEDVDDLYEGMKYSSFCEDSL